MTKFDIKKDATFTLNKKNEFAEGLFVGDEKIISIRNVDWWNLKITFVYGPATYTIDIDQFKNNFTKI